MAANQQAQAGGQQTSGQTGGIQYNQTPAFTRLPVELRLGIFKYISNWRDFLNFRHVDRANSQITNDVRTIKSFALGKLDDNQIVRFGNAIEGPNLFWPFNCISKAHNLIIEMQ